MSSESQELAKAEVGVNFDNPGMDSRHGIDLLRQSARVQPLASDAPWTERTSLIALGP